MTGYQELKATYQIETFPTIVFFKDGKEQDRIANSKTPKEALSRTMTLAFESGSKTEKTA